MTASSILCIGLTPALQHTLEFDTLQVGEVNRACSSTTSAAGKAVNVASVLARLGSTPMVTGFLGGETGRQVAELISRQGLACEWVFTGRPTRQCHTLLDSRSGLTTELVEEAGLPSPEEWSALDELLQRQIPMARLVVLTGALPLGASPAIYTRVVNWASAAGATCLVDAQKEPLRAALAGRPFLVKLNRRELEATVGNPLNPSANRCPTVHELWDGGPRWVLMTEGPEAAWLVGAGSSWRFDPPTIHAVNPIGSGDAVTAGIAHALTQGRDMPDAVQFGIACGTAAALTRTPGDSDPKVAAELLPKVNIERFNTTQD